MVKQAGSKMFRLLQALYENWTGLVCYNTREIAESLVYKFMKRLAFN